MAIINYQEAANHHTTHGMKSQVLCTYLWSMRDHIYDIYYLISLLHSAINFAILINFVVPLTFNNVSNLLTLIYFR